MKPEVSDLLATLQDTPMATDYRVLDWRAYRRAVAQGLPIPLFGPVNKSGVIVQSRVRHLRAHQVRHVVQSPLSPEFYEAAHQVDRWIVEDLRGRSKPGPA